MAGGGIIQPGRGGGIHGRGVSSRCGQGDGGGHPIYGVFAIPAPGAPRRVGVRMVEGAGQSTRDVRNSFRSKLFQGSYRIVGVTRDENGAALGNCVVDLFNASDALVAKTISDSSGNFIIDVGNNGAHYLVATLPDSAVQGVTPELSPKPVP